MTIRHTLLISFLAVSLTSALLIALMIFTHLREFLHTEIEKKLESQASTLMQQIDVTLFERMKNLSTWSQLEIMQDIRIRDIDKRLSSFLHELNGGYAGVYQQLFVSNQGNEIIAASDANLIGTYHALGQPWISTQVNQYRIDLEPLDQKHNRLLFSVALNDTFQGNPVGELYAAFDWSEILRLLQTPLLYQFPDAPSYAFLLDQNRKIIALSTSGGGGAEAIEAIPADWQFEGKSGAFHSRVESLDGMNGLAGYACSQGYRTFNGFGWCAVILQPSEYAFAQIGHLWDVIIVFLAATLILCVLLSLWLSEKFARPIVELARFTRDFMLGEKVEFPAIKASGEVAELSHQFSTMVNNLEQSRLDIIRVAKLAVVGEMAASMAHEVRTPLGILRSSAQLLEREAQLSEVGKELTGFILSETKRLNDLVTALLECAKPRSPMFAAQDIEQIIQHVKKLLQTQAEKKQVTVAIRCDMEDPKIFCDKDKLTQVFLNLIMNSLQHVQIAGSITVTIETLKKFVQIRVCDDGPGVPDEDKNAIFDPFFTRREGGIGLGLTVVQQIILAHKGRIFVTDNQPRGTCIHVQLPHGGLEEGA